jgi:hypothetical protein
LSFGILSFVTPVGKYLDMHRQVCLAGKTKSGAIWWIYFWPTPLSFSSFSPARDIKTGQVDRAKTAVDNEFIQK